MSLFFDIIPWVLKHEVGNASDGGYSNHPNDLGGATKWGISEKFLRSIPSDLVSKVPIKDLSREDAIFIYKKYFWDPSNLDALINKNTLCFKVFDIGINVGMKEAIKKLQRAYNIVNPLQPIVVDGILGKKSVKFINMGLEEPIYDRFIAAMENYYNALVANRPTQRIFLKGWLNRLNDPVPSMAEGNNNVH